MTEAIEFQFDTHAPAVLAFVRLFVSDIDRREQIATNALVPHLGRDVRDLRQARGRVVLAAFAGVREGGLGSDAAPSEGTAALGLVIFGLRSAREVAGDLGCDYHRVVELLTQALRDRVMS